MADFELNYEGEEIDRAIGKALKSSPNDIIGAEVGQVPAILEVNEYGEPTLWGAISVPREYTLTVNVGRIVDGSFEMMPYRPDAEITVTIWSQAGFKEKEAVYRGIPIEFELVEEAYYRITATNSVNIDGVVYFSPTVIDDKGEGIMTKNTEVYLKYSDAGTMETMADVKNFLSLGLDESVYKSVLVSEGGSSGFVFDMDITVPNANPDAPKVSYTMPCRVLEIDTYTRLNENQEEEQFVGATCGFDYCLPDSYSFDSPEQEFAKDIDVTFKSHTDGYYYYTSNMNTVSFIATITALNEGTDYQIGDSIADYEANHDGVYVLHHAWSGGAGSNFIKYGSNVYHESNIDKWLNGSDTTWFTPSHIGDITTSPNRIGFLNWFKVEDLSLIEKNTKWGVYERGGHTTQDNAIYRTFALLSGTEIAGSVDNYEGTVFKYWLYKNGDTVSNNALSTRTIKNINAKTTVQHCWLRSPSRSSTYNSWRLGSTGSLDNSVASSNYGAAPLFRI